MEAKTYIQTALVAGWLLGNAGCEEPSLTGTPPVRCPPNPPSVISIDMSPTWSPDGRTIAYRHGERGIIGLYLVDTTAAAPVKILDGDWFGPVELAWSPDGARIAMLFQWEIRTIDVNAHSLEQWTQIGDRYPRWPTWSPDNRYIAFALMSGGSIWYPDSLSRLRIIDTHDGNMRAIVRDPDLAPMSPAHWSSDGTTLVFTLGLSDTPGRDIYTEIFAIRADGTNLRRLTFLRGSADNPQWSADGRLIFFDFAPEQCPPGHSLNRSTWIMRPDGSGLREWPVNLGDPLVPFSYPFQLSPDGEHVAFVGADATGRYGVIHMMKLDGSGQKQLTFPS